MESTEVVFYFLIFIILLIIVLRFRKSDRKK
jgi:hypothetical protein